MITTRTYMYTNMIDFTAMTHVYTYVSMYRRYLCTGDRIQINMQVASFLVFHTKQSAEGGTVIQSGMHYLGVSYLQHLR